MRACKNAANCQYGCWHTKEMCGLNEDEECLKDVEEAEMAEIVVDMYYAGGREDE